MFISIQVDTIQHLHKKPLSKPLDLLISLYFCSSTYFLNKVLFFGQNLFYHISINELNKLLENAGNPCLFLFMSIEEGKPLFLLFRRSGLVNSIENKDLGYKFANFKIILINSVFKKDIYSIP